VQKSVVTNLVRHMYRDLLFSPFHILLCTLFIKIFPFSDPYNRNRK